MLRVKQVHRVRSLKPSLLLLYPLVAPGLLLFLVEEHRVPDVNQLEFLLADFPPCLPGLGPLTLVRDSLVGSLSCLPASQPVSEEIPIILANRCEVPAAHEGLQLFFRFHDAHHLIEPNLLIQVRSHGFLQILLGEGRGFLGVSAPASGTCRFPGIEAVLLLGFEDAHVPRTAELDGVEAAVGHLAGLILINIEHRTGVPRVPLRGLNDVQRAVSVDEVVGQRCVLVVEHL
mmetsp:Transcript_8739/g.17011  ORF Transcript_8739/g.17011 Transcript_8739/m.17011 type:complete len:231 (+) Transcript_8739:1256-1948(+)